MGFTFWQSWRLRGYLGLGFRIWDLGSSRKVACYVIQLPNMLQGLQVSARADGQGVGSQAHRLPVND